MRARWETTIAHRCQPRPHIGACGAGVGGGVPSSLALTRPPPRVTAPVLVFFRDAVHLFLAHLCSIFAPVHMCTGCEPTAHSLIITLPQRNLRNRSRCHSEWSVCLASVPLACNTEMTASLDWTTRNAKMIVPNCDHVTEQEYLLPFCARAKAVHVNAVCTHYSCGLAPDLETL